MRAVAVFPRERKVRVIDHAEPRIERDGEVLVRMLEVGVCGTDREIAHFAYGEPPPDSPYLVLGHESLGEVVAAPGVATLAPGDLVVAMVRHPCGKPECAPCSLGRQDFCVTGEFSERGIKRCHGFMTERVVEDARFLFTVPTELRAVGVLIEPLTIAEKAILQVWDIQERLPWLAPAGGGVDRARGHRALVLGAGPVGLLGAMALVSRNFDTWIYSREPGGSPKARWVESLGGHYLSAEDVPVEAFPRHIGHIDFVYEATGAAAISFAAMQMLGTNGAFVLTGVPGLRGPISIDGAGLMRNLVLKNQVVYGTVNAGPDAFAAAIQDLRAFHVRWPEQLAALVTARHTPEAAPDLLTGRPAGIKNVITFVAPAA